MDPLLSSSPSPPSSYPSTTFSSLSSSSSLHLFPLTHSSSLSHSHALSRWNSAVSPHRRRIGSNAHKQARNENKAGRRKQAVGGGGGGEREAEEGEKTPPLFFDSPKLRKTGERHGSRSPGRSVRLHRQAGLDNTEKLSHCKHPVEVRNEQQGRRGARASRK